MGTPTRQLAVVAVERVWRRLYVANMVGGAVVTAYLAVSGPPSNRPGGFNGPLAAAAMFVVFAVVLLPVSRALSGRQLGPVRAWLATSRERAK